MNRKTNRQIIERAMEVNSMYLNNLRAKACITNKDLANVYDHPANAPLPVFTRIEEALNLPMNTLDRGNEVNDTADKSTMIVDDFMEIINRPLEEGIPHFADINVPVKFIEDHMLNFNLGSAIKYIVRAGKIPNEDYITALRKAEWYIRREITR